MKPWITGIATFAFFASSIFGADVTTKRLDDVVSEVPKFEGSGGFHTREVSEVTGYYRGETLVLLRYDSELTLNLEGKARVTNSTRYFFVANEQKILGVNGGEFSIFLVASPWPIDITHVCHVQDEKGSGRCQICVPEIGFFEQIEFKDGILLPLMAGKAFEEFKEHNIEFSRKNLKKNNP